MPEAFAIVAVFAVAVVVYVGAWWQARDPRRRDARAELAQLRQHHGWLQERLAVARRERWGEEMVAQLAAEHEALSRRLAERETTGA
jgi:hypothetical protein